MTCLEACTNVGVMHRDLNVTSRSGLYLSDNQVPIWDVFLPHFLFFFNGIMFCSGYGLFVICPNSACLLLPVYLEVSALPECVIFT